MDAANAKGNACFGEAALFSYMCWILTCMNNVIAGRSAATRLWRRTFRNEKLSVYAALY